MKRIILLTIAVLTCIGMSAIDIKFLKKDRAVVDGICYQFNAKKETAIVVKHPDDYVGDGLDGTDDYVGDGLDGPEDGDCDDYWESLFYDIWELELQEYKNPILAVYDEAGELWPKPSAEVKEEREPVRKVEILWF